MFSFADRTASAVSGNAGYCQEIPSPWSILLAGGNGDRLSRLISWFHADGRPKQFATLIGTRSMLRHTYDRALALSAPSRTLVLLTAGQEGWASEQLPREAGGHFLVQSRNLGTGAAICLAIARVMAEDPRASVVIFPSDHFIWPEDRLQGFVSDALDVCGATGEPRIVLLGAEPLGPMQGMGWIVPGRSAGSVRGSSLFEVERFVEKPSDLGARRLLGQGALWNTFILAGKARSFWYLMWKRHPEAARRMDQFHHRRKEEGEERAMRAFEGLESFDFSRRVLEPSRENLLLLPLNGIRWRDWGTPEGFFETVETMGWMGRVDRKVVSSQFAKSYLDNCWLG